MRKTYVTLSSLFCVATLTWAGSALALNPQPEPPGPQSLKTNTHNTVTSPAVACPTAQGTVLGKHQQQGAATGQHGPTTLQHGPTTLACPHTFTNPGMHKLNPQPLPPG